MKLVVFILGGGGFGLFFKSGNERGAGIKTDGFSHAFDAVLLTYRSIKELYRLMDAVFVYKSEEVLLETIVDDHREIFLVGFNLIGQFGDGERGV